MNSKEELDNAKTGGLLLGLLIGIASTMIAMIITLFISMASDKKVEFIQFEQMCCTKCEELSK